MPCPAPHKAGARFCPLRHQEESFGLPGGFTELPEQVCEERLKQDTGSLLGAGRPPSAWPQKGGFPPGDSRPRLTGFLPSWPLASVLRLLRRGTGRQPGSWLARGLGPTYRPALRLALRSPCPRSPTIWCWVAQPLDQRVGCWAVACCFGADVRAATVRSD